MDKFVQTQNEEKMYKASKVVQKNRERDEENQNFEPRYQITLPVLCL